MTALLDVQHLTVTFRRGSADRGRRRQLHDRAGETLGLVGESGSGKSVTAFADPAAAAAAGADRPAGASSSRAATC